MKVTRHDHPGVLPGVFLAVVAAFTGGGCSVSERPDPWKMEEQIGPQAKALLKAAFTFDVPAAQSASNVPTIADYHLHLAARGTHRDSRDAHLHPDLNTWRHPYNKVKTLALLDAAQVLDLERTDTQYKERLLDLIRHFRHVQRAYATAPPAAHFYLYALDYHHNDDGHPLKAHSDLYVPNDYVIRVAEDFNQEQTREEAKRGGGTRARIIPVASVHPYRPDFQKRVSELAGRGVRFMKWLPPSMNVDLDKVSSKNYSVMARCKMVLLTHTGKEHTLQTRREHQRLGDPYKLRKALDHGVNVVALHSGRGGKNPDTDEPYFRRFMKMMDEEKYRGLLFGEISMMTLLRFPFPIADETRLQEIIRESQPSSVLHRRLFNGSDYPLPGVRFINPTRDLLHFGMITPEDYRGLNEIFDYNPLLFDFVLKRTIKYTNNLGRQLKLPDEVFLETRFYRETGDGPAPGSKEEPCLPAPSADGPPTH